jgi:hypothetical protein
LFIVVRQAQSPFPHQAGILDQHLVKDGFGKVKIHDNIDKKDRNFAAKTG